MPPRGRGRPQKRNTRMDAALDAMGAMGFEEAMVKATVQELLKIYTEEGWIFIEESSYRLLIDTLLEKQEALELQLIDEQGGETVAQSSAGPSSLAALPSSANCLDAKEKAIEAPKVALPVMSIPPLNSSLVNQEIDDIPGTEGAEGQNSKGGPLEAYPSNNGLPSPSLSTWSHKPSYGWISDNDDEDLEHNLIELPRMSLDEFKKQYYFRMGSHLPQRKRKSRGIETGVAIHLNVRQQLDHFHCTIGFTVCSLL